MDMDKDNGLRAPLYVATVQTYTLRYDTPRYKLYSRTAVPYSRTTVLYDRMPSCTARPYSVYSQGASVSVPRTAQAGWLANMRMRLAG